jgi:hypothetical protein
MLSLASGAHPQEQPIGRAGVRIHQVLLAVLGAAQRDTGRRTIARELIWAARHAGAYSGSREELTPITRDPRAAIPTVLAATATLLWPGTWSWFVGAVESYALTPGGWDEILAAAAQA